MSTRESSRDLSWDVLHEHRTQNGDVETLANAKHETSYKIQRLDLEHDAKNDEGIGNHKDHEVSS